MAVRLLADEEIHQLGRDLRILMATNGTLTRILAVVADEEIDVQILEQQIHQRETAESPQLSGGRILHRRVLLKGRSSGRRFVAAESQIAIDLLPRAITEDLTRTECPIGEVMAASCLETFKEPTENWIGEIPDWLARAGYRTPYARTVGRRYRIIAGGNPVIIVTEYFLDCFRGSTQRGPSDDLERS